jgi:hypothetical protein
MALPFEWCYFHFICEEMKASLVLHQTDVFGISREPYMSISLSMRDDPPTYDRRYLSVGPCFANQALLLPGIATESENDIHIDAQFDSCHLQGYIRRCCDPIEINDGQLIRDDVGNQSIWRIHVPTGIFTGTVSLQGAKTRPIHAIAYCDHQYGSIPAQDFVRNWVWGVASNGSVAYGFFRILTTAGEVIDRAFYSMPGHTETFTCLHENYLSNLVEQANPAAFSTEAAVSFGQHHMTFSINPSALIRRRLSENHGNFVFDYCRWHCRDMRGFLGFTEYMQFAR